MPNHVRSDITVTGPKEDLAKLKKLVAGVGSDGKEVPFDFQKVIPRPETLTVTSGSRSTSAIAVARFRVYGETTELDRILTYGRSEGANTPAELCERLEMVDAEYLAKNSKREMPAGFQKSLGDDLPLLEFGKLLLENKRRYGSYDWYGWCNKNWGTKWNAYDHGDVEEGPDYLRYSFDTAWASPQPIFEKLKEMFPEVEFSVEVSGEVDEEYSYTV